ncbi:hypothetical protein QBC41DRAFT_359165 [Cercophora samala]|uniref:Peptidase M12A domain-containing protein n=1 Tax=Cercophora samala TaxID=330535 RepID=A0AA39Z5E6_9PEZI|nr:hypothetical protein QBC41DRAFT_359165 [Cercophora samala]
MKTDKMNASIARNTNNPGAGELDHAHFVITPGLQWKRGEEIPTTFLNGSQRLQNKVQEHARELERHANIRFKFQPIGHGPASIIISMDPNSGSYSRIGTKSRSAAYENPDAPTMNLSIDDTTPDHEIRRTCMHELLHAIGARHEHQSPAAQIEWDEDAVYDDAARRGWTREKTDHNIVSRHDKHDVQHSRFDPDSIMMYRIRDSWTRDGFTSTGSTRLVGIVARANIPHIEITSHIHAPSLSPVMIACLPCRNAMSLCRKQDTAIGTAPRLEVARTRSLAAAMSRRKMTGQQCARRRESILKI